MRNVKRGPVKSKTRIRFKKGDKVQVIAGADKGKGPVEILKVIQTTGHLLVQGVNMRTKHLRKSQENPQGGKRQEHGPIHASNVLLWSDKLKRGVRVRCEDREGKKVRVGIPCGTVFD